MKTAIVGLGVIGKLHAQILQLQKREIVAVCDSDESKFSLCPGVAGYTDFKKMLEEVKPDVVHICTPHNLHAEMTIKALERNIHVLCEKPLCIGKEELSRVLEAEKNSSARLGVCHQNRYNEFNLFVKNYIKNKKLVGGVGTVVWNRDEEYYRSGPWRGKWDTAGGGVLINQALHTLDLLQWFLGEPEFVAASVSNLHLQGDIDVEDSVVALFSGNSNFSFFATTGGLSDYPVEIMIKTENEMIKILNEVVLINGMKKDFRKDARVYEKCCYGTGHEKLIADFYDCVETGRRFEIDGKESAKVLRLIFGVYESNGRKLSL